MEKHWNPAALSTLCVLLGTTFGTLLGVSIGDLPGASWPIPPKALVVGLCILVCAVCVAIALFKFADNYVRNESRALVGQLGGPIIAALGVLFAAYLAFSGVQAQLAVQEQGLSQSRADRIVQRLAAIREVRQACEKLSFRVNIELQKVRTTIQPKNMSDNVVVYEVSLAALRPDVDNIYDLLRRVIVSEESERSVATYLLSVEALFQPTVVPITIEGKPENRTERTERYLREEAFRTLLGIIRPTLKTVMGTGMSANQKLANEESVLLQRYRDLKTD